MQMQQTSDGPERTPIKLRNDDDQKGKNQKMKWSTDDVEIIQQTICKFPKTGLKQLRFILKTQHNIEISESSLRRFKWLTLLKSTSLEKSSGSSW